MLKKLIQKVLLQFSVYPPKVLTEKRNIRDIYIAPVYSVLVKLFLLILFPLWTLFDIYKPSNVFSIQTFDTNDTQPKTNEFLGISGALIDFGKGGALIALGKGGAVFESRRHF